MNLEKIKKLALQGGEKGLQIYKNAGIHLRFALPAPRTRGDMLF